MNVLSCVLLNSNYIYTVPSFIFVGANCCLEGTDMFRDIWLCGFDTCSKNVDIKFSAQGAFLIAEICELIIVLFTHFVVHNISWFNWTNEKWVHSIHVCPGLWAQLVSEIIFNMSAQSQNMWVDNSAIYRFRCALNFVVLLNENPKN